MVPPAQVMELRDAIREERACQICLLNYKKSGQKFWDQLYVNPVHDDEGVVTHYIEVHTDVTDVLAKATDGLPVDDVDAIEGVQAVGMEEKKRSMEICSCLADEMGKVSLSAHGACSVLPTSLLQSLTRIQQSLVLVDPNQPDMPIVHAGQGFLQLTGYPREMVIGHNCRFLQGTDTDVKEVAKVRTAITAKPPQPVTATLLNYRYDGTPFWNYLHITPIRGADGGIAYLAGVQVDVTEKGVEGEPGKVSMKHKLLHSGTVGKVKVAVRSLAGGDRGLRREQGSCELPRRGSVDYS
ncbi:unnamed protein product [Ostreobium quekettii]|uniref:PAC domain-containing protein n=1 Tax=Ostreobium quekettii TaxID=121088 RepID=A0A8S1J094_9CHLO|nr:unnamed protein product [Ostreobium quekettii]